MSTTLAGIPRVKAVRSRRAKPLEPTDKRLVVKKKSKDKEDLDEQDDILNGWRKK